MCLAPLVKYYLPTTVNIGDGILDRAGELAARFGRRALLVTGRDSMRRLGVSERLRRLLEDSGVQVTIFDEIEPNPQAESIEKGACLARESQCDFIIGLGGGSALDSAKGIAVLSTFGGSLWSYIGSNKVPGPIVPVVAIPTTAGTGSEVTPYSVFTEKSIPRKDAIASPHTFPRLALVDPLLMTSVPSGLTADTGMDVLVHAVEAYTSRSANPFSDILALEAIRLVIMCLPRAVSEGGDREARFGMALASTMAGMAIAQAGVGAAHGFGMSIGGLIDSSHGRTVGILLPHVIRYNYPEIPDKFELIAMETDSGDAAEGVTELMRAIEFPTSLSAIGLSCEHIEWVVRDSIERPDMANNPKGFSKEEAVEFLTSLL